MLVTDALHVVFINPFRCCLPRIRKGYFAGQYDGGPCVQQGHRLAPVRCLKSLKKMWMQAASRLKAPIEDMLRKMLVMAVALMVLMLTTVRNNILVFFFCCLF